MRGKGRARARIRRYQKEDALFAAQTERIAKGYPRSVAAVVRSYERNKRRLNES